VSFRGESLVDEFKLKQGIALFNTGKFFEAHEALEDVWREMRGPERRYLQGLIQVAAGFHHYSRGNLEGARSLIGRGSERLDHAPDFLLGIALVPLRRELMQWLQALAYGSPPPGLPRCRLVDRC
jgi:uncharacterized protein